MPDIYHAGYVAIVGRPNVGKSTLMNRILGQKISITSHKPQTTRHRILGIHTVENGQAVFVDTPGIHLGGKKAMNRYLNRAATNSIIDVDLALFVIEAQRWTEEDEAVLKQLVAHQLPIVLVINKIDEVKDKETLLPLLAEHGARHDFVQVIPLSARKGDNVEALEKIVIARLPDGTPIFPDDQVTDRSSRFMAAEIVREKLMRSLGKELPYATSVEIEQFADDEGMLRINALIWVERASQKSIVIGKGGAMLKRIGKEARIDMERMFEQKVFLQLWVKVKEGWSDNERILQSLGYRDE